MYKTLSLILNNILLVVCFIGFAYSETAGIGIYVGLGLIMVIVDLIYRAYRAKNIPFLVIFILFSSYCIAPQGYLFGIEDNIIKSSSEAESKNTVILTSLCLLTFITVFSRFIKMDIPSYQLTNGSLLNYKSKGAYITTLLISIACMSLGLSGTNMFEAGGYNDDLGSRTSLYEYGVIFISLSLIYSRNSRDRQIIYVICALFVIRDFLYAGRISSFMLLLSVYIIRFMNQFSFKRVLIYLVVGYVVFQIFGVFRSTLSGDELQLIKKDDNAAYVFYASMRLHYLIDIGVLSIELRVLSFLGYLASVFVPLSMMPSFVDLASFMKDEYFTAGGGLISSFFYTWTWIPGVVIIAFYLAKQLNCLFKNWNPYRCYYAVLLLITTPRWFAYFPTSIIKYALWGLLAFWVFNHLFKIKIVRHETSNNSGALRN